MPEMPGGVSLEARLASIIIPTFNGASRIGNCLDSLVKQMAGHRLIVRENVTIEAGELE